MIAAGRNGTDAPHHPLSHASAWRARATRFTTPASDQPDDGHVVWHRWQPEVVLDDTPLVLLHGGSGSWTHWLPSLPALRDAGRTVWAADTPGFGDSAAPTTGSTNDDLLPPLQRGLKQLLGTAPVDLVGFSHGGLLAAMWCAAEPMRARRLVLVGPPGLGVAPAQPFQLRAWRHLPTADQDAVHRHNLTALMLHNASLIDEAVMAWHVDNVQRDRLPRRRLAQPDFLAHLLSQIDVPLHAIIGEQDALYRGHTDQLRSVFKRQAPQFSGLTLIPNAGHWVMFEQKNAFDAALKNALSA